MVDKTNYTEKAHLPWLDMMRFVAAFLVLLCHSRNDYFVRWVALMPNEQNVLSFAFFTIGRLGSEAVFAFFILSGFLVGGPGLERIFNGTFRKRSYAIDRTVRIMLPLIAAVVLYLIVATIIGQDFSWWTVIGNILNLQCICCDALVSPFWSLSYEVWFYIVLFSLALSCGKGRSRVLGYVLFFICTLVYTRMNALYLLIWLIGAVAWLTRPRRGNRWILMFSVAVILLSCVGTQLTKDSKAMHFDLSLDPMAVTLTLCMGISMLAQQVICFPPKSRVAKWIEAVGSAGAKFSYSLYLMHRIIMLLIFPYIFESA